MSEPEPSDSGYDDADDVASGRLSPAEVDQIRAQLSEKCAAVSAYLLSSKEPVEKRRIVKDTVQDLMTAFNQMAASYLRVSAVSQTTKFLKSALSKTIKEEVALAVRNAFPVSAPTSYAGITAKRASKQESVKLKVHNGPTVVLPSTVSVVIGPKKTAASRFSNADDTRKAVMQAVDPTAVGMRVNKVVGTRNNAVRIIADCLDVGKLKMCPALEAAGLEVKERERLNPRLIIRDVPTDINNDDLAADIAIHNLEVGSKDAIKIVYRYPSRHKDDRASVVIETEAGIRRKLLDKERICLAWQTCKIEDHIRVLQCYKCQDFGHLAKNCTSPAICGRCAGPHDTSSCSVGVSSLKCCNCCASKLPNFNHKAFDVSKCPILKRRLKDKAKNIAY